MEPAEELYSACQSVKPAWDQLGDVTRSVWRGYVAKGVTVKDYQPGAFLSPEFERCLLDRILPLLDKLDAEMIVKNTDPNWPFPESAVDAQPPGPVQVALDPKPVEAEIVFPPPAEDLGIVVTTLPGLDWAPAPTKPLTLKERLALKGK